MSMTLEQGAADHTSKTKIPQNTKLLCHSESSWCFSWAQSTLHWDKRTHLGKYSMQHTTGVLNMASLNRIMPACLHVCLLECRNSKSRVTNRLKLHVILVYLSRYNYDVTAHERTILYVLTNPGIMELLFDMHSSCGNAVAVVVSCASRRILLPLAASVAGKQKTKTEPLLHRSSALALWCVRLMTDATPHTSSSSLSLSFLSFSPPPPSL